jgi:hypothetical protein
MADFCTKPRLPQFNNSFVGYIVVDRNGNYYQILHDFNNGTFVLLPMDKDTQNSQDELQLLINSVTRREVIEGPQYMGDSVIKYFLEGQELPLAHCSQIQLDKYPLKYNFRGQYGPMNYREGGKRKNRRTISKQRKTRKNRKTRRSN